MSKKHKFLLRFDDICPTMDWNQWKRACAVLEEYKIKPLIGVIPNCFDPKLNIDSARGDFWNYIKELQTRGFAIAMHGYEHQYSSQSAGIVGLSRQSEFAGLTYDEQLEKLAKGKNVFDEKGIIVDTFFAPSHSYDLNTLKALNELGFKWVSDGKGIMAKRYKHVKLLPCINHAIPRRLLGDYITVVNHSNEWEKNNEGYTNLKDFCKRHHDEIVTFDEFKNQPIGIGFINDMIEQSIVFYQRNIKKYK